MNKKQFAKEYLKEIQDLSQKINLDDLVELMEVVERTYKKGKTLFVAGNGGSAATASHMVCDLQNSILNRNPGKKKRFRVISLGDNLACVTAIANDYDYNRVFSETLLNLGGKGDVLLVISASGNSKNILEVIKVAKTLGLTTIAFLGFNGGKVLSLVDKAVVVPSNDFGPVEDFHMIFDHLLTNYFKTFLG